MSIARGLVGWWRLDGNLTDASGNGNHGTVGAGSAAYAAGVYGQAWNANGANTVRVSHNASLDLQTLTISFWAKRTGTINNNDQVLGRPVSLSPTDVPYRLYFGSDLLFSFNFVNSGTSRTVSDPHGISTNANIWFNYAVTVLREGSNTNISLYRNGGLIASADPPEALPIRTSDLFIGGENNRRFFAGQLDNLMIYNRALSPSEIKTLYALGSPL